MNGKLLQVLACLALAVPLPLWSLTPGSEETLTLASPELLSGGTNTASLTPVQGDILNPAASGGNQRLTLDLNYTGLISSGLEGFLLNFGGSYPTRIGVFTGSFQVLSSGIPTFNTGTATALNFSFAKDVYRNLYLGAGVGAGFHLLPGGGADWSAGLDLGVIHFLGDLGPLYDLRWGASLRDIGKTSGVSAGAWPLPALATLGLAGDFKVIRDKDLVWGVHTDLALPTFQNFRFSLGTDVTLWQILSLSVGWQIDALDLMAAPSRSLIPTVGLGVNFKADLGEGAQALGLEEKYRRSEF